LPKAGLYYHAVQDQFVNQKIHDQPSGDRPQSTDENISEQSTNNDQSSNCYGSTQTSTPRNAQKKMDRIFTGIFYIIPCRVSWLLPTVKRIRDLHPIA
jgi:hypothetical protein